MITATHLVCRIEYGNSTHIPRATGHITVAQLNPTKSNVPTGLVK